MRDIILQFGGVFVGAFLAIGLENTRQRWMTRRWVRVHCAHLQALLIAESPTADHVAKTLQELLEAIDRWRTASDPGDLDEETWQLLSFSATSAPLDLGYLIRSDSLNVLPQALATALTDTEFSVRGNGFALQGMKNRFESELRPLWYARTAPLDPISLRKLEVYREHVTDVISMETNLREVIGRLTEALYRF